MSLYPGVDAGRKYAIDIVGGKIIACKWVRLACETFLADLRKEKDADYPYYFDKKAAERVCKFVSMMPHTKGKWARERRLLELEPWQSFFIINIFGWKRKKDGLRRYRRAELFVPRKNGKSALAAAIGNYMFCADGEYGAEVYSGATTEKQAYEVFTPAKLMISKSPDLVEHKGIDVRAQNMNIVENGSKFEPIIGNPGDGSSPSCAIVDEYHEHKDDRMMDTMETGMGAREQPLLLMITTAGDNLSGPCYQMQKTAEKMLEGVISDDQTFALIYTVDEGDDWTSLETIKKANPNYGVSVNEDYFANRLQDAKNNARKQSTFKTKHLNVWVGARNAFFNVGKWNSCADKSLNLYDFKGKKCYIGMDLASKVDIAALEILFPMGNDNYVRFGKYYLPESAVLNGGNEHYQGWMRDGWLTITDGEIIDFNEIKSDILELSSMFQVAELCYDPHQATMLVTELMDEGVPVLEVRPTVLNFSEPMKMLDALIRANQIKHNDDPVMTWMISNVVATVDAKDNVYPRKDREENKIDGVVAHLMALGRCISQRDFGIDDAISGFLSVNI